jgi:hypothetical protein
LPKTRVLLHSSNTSEASTSSWRRDSKW